MKPFEKIIKRPALMNYYLNRKFHWPDTLPEIFDYLRQRDELPFLYGGDNCPTTRCANGSAVRGALHRSS